MRNPPPSFGHLDVGNVSEKRVADLQKGNPLSNRFEYPNISTAKELTNYMLAVQSRYRNGNALEHFSYPTLVRHSKLLLGEYTVDEIARGIVRAASIASNPSTIKHIKECIEWIQHQRS